MINKAIMFATTAHSNQKRKGTGIPYIFHVLEAGIIASQITDDENVIAAAILHDTLEDVHITIESIKKIFNNRISELVGAESEDKTKSWKERKQATIDFLMSTADEDIKIIALADKLSNIRSIYRDELTEGENLWLRFNEKNKNEHGWYYQGLVESLNSLSKYSAFEEFKSLVQKVFFIRV